MGFRSLLGGIFGKKKTDPESVVGSYPNKPRTAPPAAVKKKKKKTGVSKPRLTGGKIKTNVKAQSSSSKSPVRGPAPAMPPRKRAPVMSKSTQRRTKVQRSGTKLAGALLAGEVLEEVL